MAQRHQRGWLKKEERAQGETWVLFFRTTRQSDGKRVENKVPIGLVRHLPEASSAWAEVERLHVPINRVDVRRGVIFGDLAQHYAEHELVEASESIRPKAHTTIKGYEQVLREFSVACVTTAKLRAALASSFGPRSETRPRANRMNAGVIPEPIAQLTCPVTFVEPPKSFNKPTKQCSRLRWVHV
jgi:hypothetical protein